MALTSRVVIIERYLHLWLKEATLASCCVLGHHHLMLILEHELRLIRTSLVEVGRE